MKTINKFYIFIAALILVLGVIMIYSIKTVFDAFTTSNQIEQGERLVNIDEQKLEDVYNWSFNRENVSLEIPDTLEQSNIGELDEDAEDQGDENE